MTLYCGICLKKNLIQTGVKNCSPLLNIQITIGRLINFRLITIGKSTITGTCFNFNFIVLNVGDADFTSRPCANVGTV